MLPALLQDTIAETKQISSTLDTNRKASLSCDLFAHNEAIARIRSKLSHAPNMGRLGGLRREIGRINDGAVVVIVSVEVVEPEPGVAVAGEKEQDVRDGCPEHVNETGFVNAPNCEATVIV